MTTIQDSMRAMGVAARAAARQMARSTLAQRNRLLQTMADGLSAKEDVLLAANEKDIKAGEQNNLASALLDRLALNPERIAGMAAGLRQIAALPDPLGEISGMNEQPSGIRVGKMRVPLGVAGIIYESRPNVTADAAGLCLKSGNAAILRGGSEAIHSNQAIAAVIRDSLQALELPECALQVVKSTDRAAVGALLTLADYVDIIIPRGGKGLIERVSREACMPVIKHLDGICHVYVDAAADLDKAVAVAFNAKTQRYGTCNTMECLLLARSIAQPVLSRLYPMLMEAGVELRVCAATRDLLGSEVALATEEDYATEWLAPVLSVRIVRGLEEAMAHIEQYGSRHTDAIITENFNSAQRFLAEVDSSSVMLNASTRFADGFEYGLGAEIGISTDRFHARGPVGLEGLTSQKFVVIGDGHIRT